MRSIDLVSAYTADVLIYYTCMYMKFISHPGSLFNERLIED